MTPDIQATFRAEVIHQLEWAEPAVVEQVLARIATVPGFEDDATYVTVAAEVARAALIQALQPTFARLRAERDDAQARIRQLEAAEAFDAFLRTKTTKTSTTIH